MPGFLRQSTASQSRALGPFIDSTDFKTTKTGLTIANTDIQLIVNGGASANKNSGGGTHRANGVYGVTFDATDTATVGEMEVSVVVATALPVFDKFIVVEEAVYDALFVAAAPGYVVDQAVNVTKFGGTTVTARDIGASVLLSSGAGTGQLDFTSGVVKANATQWVGGTIPAVNVTGVPLVDAKYLLGTIFATPATAGIPDVNVKNIANAAVSTTTAQIGVNAVNIGGTAQTGRDLGASVLLSSGTGAGQLDFTSGVVKANLAQILGTALTETSGQIAAAFKKFFNIAAPAATMDHGVLVDTVTNVTNGVTLAADQAVNVTKFGGTSVTARDIGASVLLSNGTGTGQVKLSSGYVAPNWGDVGNPTTAVNLSATLIQGVNSLATGTDSVSTIATSGSTLTTGIAAAGTYASTKEQDGSYWQIADATGTLDMYFEFNVGSLGVPTTALWVGGLTTAVDTLKVFAYNWAGVAWEQIGSLTGTSSLIINEQEYNFTTSHVGTGGNLGLVRLRFQNTGLVSANFYTDRVLCSYTNVYSFPSNFASLAIDGSGRVDLGSWIGTAPLALSSQLVQVKTNSIVAGAITAAAIATDAIDADALAADAVTEIQSGLSTLTAADVRSAVGLASANLDTQLSGIQTDTDDIQTRLPAALVSGRMDASVGAMAANVVTASAIAADAIGASELAADAVSEIAAGVRTELTTELGRIDVAVSTRLATAGYTAPPSVASIADGVWDEAIAGHLGAGSTGASLNGAGSVGDPWVSVLEGSLTAGDLLRVTAGVAAGKDNIVDLGGGAATVTFRDAADTTTIVTATMAGSKRTAVSITP